MFAVFSRARKAAILGVTLLAGAVLAACDTMSIGGGPSIDTSKPVPVALLVPKGSAQPGDAVLAQSLESAARLAIGDLQGVKIDLRVYDTAGNAATASTAASQAVSDGARIILGPVYAEAANAAGLAVRGKNINVLSFSNTNSNDYFMRACRKKGITTHPARMHMGVADFFIEFLTDPGDLVLDPFAGSGTTCYAAESAGRRWIGCEIDPEYIKQVKIRFKDPALTKPAERP